MSLNMLSVQYTFTCQQMQQWPRGKNFKKESTHYSRILEFGEDQDKLGRTGLDT